MKFKFKKNGSCVPHGRTTWVRYLKLEASMLPNFCKKNFCSAP